MRVRGKSGGCQDVVAHFLAQAFNIVTGRISQRVQSLVIPLGVNVAVRSKFVFQHPGFKIEIVRIPAAMRLFEPYGELPAFSGMNIETGSIFMFMTGKQDACRNGGVGGEYLFYIKCKA